ncbi:MAG: hypothetical protein F6K62_01990 [Sphaerospermopsis sp. SIO1G2]|nr:hypothetical protein [Sphaerospermopsis sp. SIO1G1]NET69847.1 hypothetical protein [Sphaerospermopsis sp. SIO1G2]
MITNVERRYSLDEYHAIEEQAEIRNEYHDGEIIPMPGISLKHSRISGNIFAFIKFFLRDSYFEPINSDLETSIFLESIKVELPIADIYRGIVFE